MKNITKTIILAVAMAALAALLLTGCREEKRKADTTSSVEQVEAKVDTIIKDTMEAFNERMRQWRVLHGGMSRWESDK